MRVGWEPCAELETLKSRALYLRKIRDWFYLHNVLEVETPVIVTGATTDPHIDSFSVGERVLRTSSEFHQKRLLAAGVGDNFEIGKVFRREESGRYHNPEFTMLEWYRLGIDHPALIDEIKTLLAHLHGENFPGLHKVSYRELWQQYGDIDIAECSVIDLERCLTRSGIQVPAGIKDNFNELLDLGMATGIADSMAKDLYTCVYHYPASQASLSRIDNSDEQFPVACRFEIFFGAVELANGYYELTDAKEQLRRFYNDNQLRAASNKTQMPVDHKLIAAMHHGLPQCAGVAIGFDRLLMVLLDQVNAIDKTMTFSWELA